MSLAQVEVLGVDSQERVLRDLRKRAEAMRAAREAYERALYAAREAQIPNTEIARTVGISEAGVRMFFKRREEVLS